MVSPKLRRHRRSRHRRSQDAYLLQTASPKRFKLFFLSPLLVVALHLTLAKQRSIAQPFEPPIPQTAFRSPSWVPKIAQAVVPIPLSRQGQQITLNGRVVTAPWSQRQQSIGITDAGLREAFGVDLLSSTDATRQPINWYSDTPQTTPLVLSTWLTEQYRYLDIADLAQRFGWQVQVHGSALQVSTPSAQITAVRQGRQDWGDRIALDLDQPAPWQVVEQPGEVTITIDAQITPAQLRSFMPQPGNQLTSLKIESSGNRTVIHAGVPENLHPHVWSLANPNRLLIDLRSDAIEPRDILWSPGVRWRQQMVSISSGQFPVVALEVDPRQAGVRVKPILSSASTVVGTVPLSTAAQRFQVAGAINAGYFNRNTQLPLGAIRKDNRWISGPILNRGAIGWDDAGNITVGHLTLQETLTTSTGQQLPVMHLNSGYVGEGLYRHTPDWGATYTNVLDNELLITVKQDQVIKQQRSAKAGSTTIPIPPDGYVLVARSDQAAAAALAPGTRLHLETAIQPPAFASASQIIGAGPLLLQNSQIVLNPQAEKFSTAFVQQAAPRSVIATTPQGTLMLVTVHNRSNGWGPTLAEAAQIMQQMGAIDALNLDGGSSTSLYLGGQLLDRAPSTAARINNGIGVFIQPNL